VRLFSALVVAAAATLGTVSDLGAQARPAVQSIGVPPGTRVRVRSSSMVAPLVANFLQLSADTAVFIEDAAGRGIWSIQVNDITQLERSDGEKRNNGRDMMRYGLFGAGAGAVGGIVFAATFQPSDDKKKYDRLTTGLVGAGAGALVGVLIGSRKVREHWVEVPLRRVSVVPSRRGVSVGAGIDF
jgi:hypothetical protein